MPGSRRHNLEAYKRIINGTHIGFNLPAKIDGVKQTVRIGTDTGMGLYLPIKIDGVKQTAHIREEYLFRRPAPRWMEAKESLEILFAWGRDGHQQSLTWSMDGLLDAFWEACGEELVAEEK